MFPSLEGRRRNVVTVFAVDPAVLAEVEDRLAELVQAYVIAAQE